MKLDQLNLDDPGQGNEKLNKCINHLKGILAALNSRELPPETAIKINQEINELNTFPGDAKALKKKVRKAKVSILKIAEKDLNLVPKGHYRTQWMALGMTVFGLPMGVAFSAALDNYAFIGIGLPIGMSIGMAVGAGMDEKARKEGRQLDVDTAY